MKIKQVSQNVIELHPEHDDEWKDTPADDVQVYWSYAAGSSGLDKALVIDLSVIGEQDE